MKLAFIFESGEDGAEAKVIPYLASFIDPTVEIWKRHVFNINKPAMIQTCGTDARQLLAEGCDRVIIVCDLGSDRSNPLRPKKLHWQAALEWDIRDIRDSLQAANADVSEVRLLVIREELETWFLADHGAVEAHLSTRTRPCSLNAVRRPETIKDPKTALKKIFQQYRPRVYSDLEDAINIAKHMTDPKRLRNICSFVRFQALVTEPELPCRRCDT